MGHDAENDAYTCHIGKSLIPLYIKKQKSRNGYESTVTVYECIDCCGCPCKDKCTRAIEFQRFLLRGKTKVKLEILLLRLGYYINKLHAKIQNDRLGSHMLPLKTA